MAAINTIDSEIKGGFSDLVNKAVQNNNAQPVVRKNKSKYEYDRLKMLFGEPYFLTQNLTIYQPTIGDILQFGEKRFFQILNMFISHPTQYRVQLWDAGVDWNTLTDYELFRSLLPGLKPQDTTLLFGDVDFSKFQPQTVDFTDEEKAKNEELIAAGKKPLKQPVILINEAQDILLDENVYDRLADYLRTLFNIFPKNEKVKGKSTKQDVINEDRLALEKAKDNPNSSFLFPLVSACINSAGFKYKLQELREVGIFEFMDSVQRIPAIASSIALNNGAYSGMCDVSKVDKKLFNIMRDLNDD